jgi:hypothetical protein
VVTTIRRIDAGKYHYDDPRKYLTAMDCPSQPDVLRAYHEKHPKAVCVGGYGYFGCCPGGKKREDFVRYDFDSHRYVRSDGKTIQFDETYCGRKMPHRSTRA